MNEKRLFKSRDKKISGVCGGVAEYLNVDPTIVRLIWALVALSTGIGFVAYIVAAIVMEEDPGYTNYDNNYNGYTNANDDHDVKGFKP